MAFIIWCLVLVRGNMVPFCWLSQIIFFPFFQSFVWFKRLIYNTRKIKAGLILNNLYGVTCMIQLVWLCKIANSCKLDVEIFVWYNFWKIRCVLFLPTCMKEIDQSYLIFHNAELFWKKIQLNEWSLNQVSCVFCKKFLWEVKNQRWSEKKKWKRQAQKEVNVELL